MPASPLARLDELGARGRDPLLRHHAERKRERLRRLPAVVVHAAALVELRVDSGARLRGQRLVLRGVRAKALHGGDPRGYLHGLQIIKAEEKPKKQCPETTGSKQCIDDRHKNAQHEEVCQPERCDCERSPEVFMVYASRIDHQSAMRQPVYQRFRK